MKLSLVLATYNEQGNIVDCIRSAKSISDEVIVVDGSSMDDTAKLARGEGAQVIATDNPAMFHINKQKAIDAAQGNWILQLDADERVTPELAEEIKRVVQMNDEDIEKYERNLTEKMLFERYEARAVAKNTATYAVAGHGSRYNAFFIPRLNYFLGRYLRYGGVYPDGVIRLFRKGKAHLPCKDVHELMEVEGRVGWLQNPLQHIDSPTFKRYLERNSRYINLMAEELKVERQMSKLKNTGQKSQTRILFEEVMVGINWLLVKPISWFIMTTFRHKGILDGWQGVVFSFFSALRFPRAYWRATFNRGG